VRKIISKSTYEDFQDEAFEDFQDQVYEDFKSKYTRTPIFSFQSNEASVLEDIVHVFIFSIYSIELELHDRKVCFVRLC
jgi:hypothetical protein